MNKTHYFLCPVLIYDGPDLKHAMHRALVSGSGVYKAFEESDENYQAFAERRIFHVRLDGADYEARLVREAGPSGTHYNLHLINGKEMLAPLVKRYGFESPWRRSFARIPASSVFTQCEVPVGAVLLHENTSSEVRNFSYHGLFLDLHTPAGETVGQLVKFRLMTSRGKMLEEATGRIARIYDEILAPGILKRGLGIRLLEMPDRSQKIYYGMILDACRELQSKI